MIILLDHNFTLVANSDVKLSPFTRQIAAETYRQDLVDAIRDQTVILITARPHKYREETLSSIKAKTGWSPAEAYFNTENDRPPVSKRKVLERHLLNRFKPYEMFGIESNPQTRGMYATFGIRSQTYAAFIAAPSLFSNA
jgi:hypothetical protein